jgi:hypothetical protein
MRKRKWQKKSSCHQQQEKKMGSRVFEDEDRNGHIHTSTREWTRALRNACAIHPESMIMSSLLRTENNNPLA